MMQYKQLLVKLMLVQLVFSLHWFKGYGQVEISGPQCVVRGMGYQYNISGNRDSLSTLRVCIEGGQLQGSDLSCKTIADAAQLRVKWDNDENVGRIIIQTSSGDISKSVTITSMLDGGFIDSIKAIQSVEKNTIPSSIICSEASGGSCSPLYEYLWQSSFNNMDWEDISEKKSKDLNFTSPISTVTYFRRKVVEKISNSVSYSNVAVVWVQR